MSRAEVGDELLIHAGSWKGEVVTVVEASPANDLFKVQKRSSAGRDTKIYRQSHHRSTWCIQKKATQDACDALPYAWGISLDQSKNEQLTEPKENEMKLNLYQIAVLSTPAENEKVILILAPEWVLAKDETAARLMAARKLPPEQDENEVDIKVRTF